MDASNLQNRLLFAVPKKGRLSEQCLNLLKGADIKFYRSHRLDIALCTNQPIAIIFLPASDIARFVADGNVDLGITGQDIVLEDNATVKELLKLGFGKCELCFQAPISSDLKSIDDLIGKRIVTSFENITRNYFYARESGMSHQEALVALNNNTIKPIPLKTKISYISGSVEAACSLGLADAIVDLVESGETMRAAKLFSLGSLVSTQAVLLGNPKKLDNPLIETIKRRIEGVIVADKYVLCNYNVPRANISKAVKITPGKRAPSISPLEDESWVAVSAMVLKKDIADIMDQLSAVGAEDILVFAIHNCRSRVVE